MFSNFMGRKPPPSPTPPPPEPELVPGYKLGEVLGIGRLGEVYAAVHESGRNMAVKMLRAELAQDTIAQMRFRRQAQMQLKLTHPKLVKVLELGDASDGRTFIGMERVVGHTLNGKAPLEPSRVAEVIESAARALEFMHKNRMVHLDVNPANLFRCDNGEFRLMGLSFSRGDMTPLTKSNEVPGTPAYMAPEQAQGEPNARSDQFSLGMVACELLTGTLPIEGVCPPLPTEAATSVVQKMISPKFEQRYASVEAAAKAFAQSLG
jgi:serine/threonine protein kinase